MALTIILLYIVIILIIFTTFFENSINKFLKFSAFVKEKTSGELGVWQIPGPKRLPFLGTGWIFFWKYKLFKLHDVMLDLNRTYGPIVLQTTSSGIPIVSIFDRNDIEKVIKQVSKYPNRPPTEITIRYRAKHPERYSSSGIVNEYGQTWHNLRTNLTQQITSPKVIQNLVPTLNEVCDDFITLIRQKRDNNNVIGDVQELSKLLALEAACLVMLGRRMGYLDNVTGRNENKSAFELAEAMHDLFVTQRDSYYGLGLWKYLPTKTARLYGHSETIIYDIVSKIVENTLAEDELTSADDNIKHIYISILQTNLDIREKKSAIIDFIGSSIETIGNTIIFFLYYLGRNPECQEKICSEFEYSGDEITYDTLAKSVYTKACIQEAFRICPTACFLSRILEEDMVLSGYNLNKGQVVICQTYAACRNPKNFSNPLEYIPDRWINDNQTNSRSTEPGVSIVIPFGMGKRMCPGKRLVEIESLLYLAKIIKAFKIEYLSELDPEFEFLLVPKSPVVIKFCDRLQ